MINSEIKCPNCFEVLLSKPKRKQECPHCKKFIFVRKGELVTKDQSIIIDWLEFFEELEMSHHDNLELEEDQILRQSIRESSRQSIYEAREKLRDKLGYQPTIYETIWAILNEFLIRYAGDDSALEQIYRAMASLVSREGKDPTQYILEAERLKKQQKKKLLDDLDIEEDDEDEPPALRKRMFLGDALPYIRMLRRKGQFNKAEMMLMNGLPSPAVCDELRKIASTRAKIAKRGGDWESVLRHLEGYNKYAAKWRAYCVKTGNQEPPLHTTSGLLAK